MSLSESVRRIGVEPFWVDDAWIVTESGFVSQTPNCSSCCLNRSIQTNGLDVIMAVVIDAKVFEEHGAIHDA